MNVDQALELMTALLKATLFVAGPVLAVSLLAGVVVGVLQAATQVNEATLSYVVKVAAVIALVAAAGSPIASEAVRYTRQSLLAIATVTR